LSDSRTIHLSLVFIFISLISACSRPPRLEGPPPYILLIVMDAARADHFSCYGYSKKTAPVIDRVAQEGARFSRAVSTSSWTLPAHASLFTGLLPLEHGATRQHDWLIDRIPTLAQLLKTSGYRTAGFSNNPKVDTNQNMHRGFDLFVAIWSDTTVTTTLKPHNTEHTNRLVRSFLEAQPEQPFFVFINYMDVHTPYDPPEPYRSRYLKPGQEITARIDSACRDASLSNREILKLNGEEISVVRNIYNGAINYLDAKIGELLDYLREKGDYDNTLVIITSDHGELFGEYGGYFGHGGLLYRPLVHIPLVIRYPGLVPSSAVRDDLVGIADIFHSLAALLSLEGASPTGASKRNLFAEKIERAPCYSDLKLDRIPVTKKIRRRHDTRSVWTPDNRHYIICEDELYECFDLTSDFKEEYNLCPLSVTKDAVTASISGMEQRLVKFVESAEDLRINSPRQIDPQFERTLRALGYVGGGEDESSLKEHPHVLEHLKTGIFFFNRDSLDAAEREIRNTLAMNPANPIAPPYLGGVLFGQGKYQEAVRVLRSILGQTDVDAEVRGLLAQSLAALGRKDEALEQLRILSKMRLKAPDSYLQAAAMLMEMGDFKTADVFSMSLLEDHPDHLPLVRRLIELHCRYENWATAMKLLLHEISEAPVPDAYLMLSQVALEMGLNDEAHRNLEKVLRMNISPEIRARVIKQLDYLKKR